MKRTLEQRIHSARSHRRTEAENAKAKADIEVRGGGTVYMFTPLSIKATLWLQKHCPPDGEHQYLGISLACEHRYAGQLAAGMQNDGLVVV